MPKAFQKNLVSIIIPTLNEGIRLNRLFQSIQDQTYRLIEILVVDSHETTDNTSDIIDRWQKNFPIALLKKNQLLGQARRIGAQHAKGEYLLHIDADMLLTPKLVETCIAKIKSGAKAVKIPEKIIGHGYWTRCRALEKQCYVYDEGVTSPRFFSAQAYFAVGGHNPQLALSEDKDIDLRFQDHHQKILWTDQFLLHDEDGLTPKSAFLSKYFWAQTGFAYLKARPRESAAQFFFILFRPAFFRNWRLLLSNPHLTLGLFILKFSEIAGTVVGGLGTKLKLIKPVEYETKQKNSLRASS